MLYIFEIFNMYVLLKKIALFLNHIKNDMNGT